MSLNSFVVCLFLIVALSAAQKNPNFAPGRNGIVHLFEWKWTDIALECERFLSVKGFGGIQVSPPSENIVILSNNDRPWWERYQVVSYVLETRSGNETEFADMVRRCNAVGVRIYVDAVINHMTGGSGVGTAGNKANKETGDYPGVPYTGDDFHFPCPIVDFNDPQNVRYCELVGLKDLDQGKEHVRAMLVNYMNHLVGLGVAGFRVDAAKHIWPGDLHALYSATDNLPTGHGFAAGARPFIFQEVPGSSGDRVNKNEYTALGTVVEFEYSSKISSVFMGNDKLAYLNTWGRQWGFVDGFDAVPFVDNHDRQRTESSYILTHKRPRQYKMAVAFMLAHPYGTPKVMSSFAFENNDQGPPHDEHFNIVSPGINPDETCSNGWVCEHRWRQVFGMIGFRNAVEGTPVENWWSNGDNQIAFSRGSKGFVAFTNGGDIHQSFKTGLPAGTYCDVITGEIVDGNCTGKLVKVENDGTAFVTLKQNEEDGVLAIHVNERI